MKQSQLDRIEAAQRRIEAKLDALIDVLADDQGEEDQPSFDLDGFDIPGERSGLDAL